MSTTPGYALNGRSAAPPARRRLYAFIAYLPISLRSAVDRLSEKPLSLHALRCPLLLYLVAAQGLQERMTPELGTRREALLKRAETVFRLPLGAVAEDLRGMMTHLQRDHFSWLRRHGGRPAELPHGKR